MIDVVLKITDFIGFGLKQNSSVLTFKSGFIVSGAQFKSFVKQRYDNLSPKEITRGRCLEKY